MRATGLVVALITVMAAACSTSTEDRAAPSPGESLFEAEIHELLPPDVVERGVLRIGTDASYAPMSSFGTDGRTIIGAEPDLAEEMGEVLGVRVEMVTTDFTALLPDVADGELDLAMSAITDTPERATAVDFVNYFSAGTSILVQRGNPTGITQIDHLCGEVVAVEEGTTQVDLLARTQRLCDRPIQVTTYPTNSDALLELRTGRAVAVLNDLPPAVHLVTDPRTQQHFQLASTTTYEPGMYGVAVARTQPGLRDAVRAALAVLVENGVYEDVLDRWGVLDGGIAQISVNSNRAPAS